MKIAARQFCQQHEWRNVHRQVQSSLKREKQILALRYCDLFQVLLNDGRERHSLGGISQLPEEYLAVTRERSVPLRVIGSG